MTALGANILAPVIRAVEIGHFPFLADDAAHPVPALLVFVLHASLLGCHQARLSLKAVSDNSGHPASDGSCLLVVTRLCRLWGFPLTDPFFASTRLQLGLGRSSFDFSASDPVSWVLALSHGLALLLYCCFTLTVPSGAKGVW